MFYLLNYCLGIPSINTKKIILHPQPEPLIFVFKNPTNVQQFCAKFGLPEEPP